MDEKELEQFGMSPYLYIANLQWGLLFLLFRNIFSGK